MKKLLLFLFCLILSLYLLSCKSAIVKKQSTKGFSTEGLCLFVSFDEVTNSQFKDMSKNGYTVENSGEVQFTKQGRINGAATFDGNSDYLTFTACKNNDLGAAGSSYSVSAWINTAITSESDLWHRSPVVITKRDPNSKNRPFLFYITMDGKIGLHFEEPKEEIEGQTIISDGKWHHIAMRRNGSQAELFVDGKKEIAGNITDNDKNNEGLFMIGARFRNNGEPTGFFKGSIDEVRIFTRSLTDNEMLKLFKQEV